MGHAFQKLLIGQPLNTVTSFPIPCTSLANSARGAGWQKGLTAAEGHAFEHRVF